MKILRIGKLLHNIYYNNKPLTQKEMYVSRSLSIFEGSSARTIFTFTSGAFLVGYAKYLGASDQLAAIISAIQVFSSIIMILSPIIFESLPNRKFTVAGLCFIGRLLLGGMIFIPFFAQGVEDRILMLICAFIIANFLISFSLPAAQTWLAELTPQQIRGRYFGTRESYVLAFVTFVTLIAGKVLDFYKKNGNEFEGFKILYIIVFIFAFLNFIFLSAMKEKRMEVKNQTVEFIKLIRLPFKDAKFRKLLILLIFWNLSFQIAAPFTNVYMISGLKLSYMYITVMTTISAVVSVLIVRLWGKLADKKSWLFLANVLLLIQSLCFFTWFIVNKNNYYLFIPIASFLFGAAISGMNITIFNLQYGHAPEEGKTIYLGLSTALSGVFGFVGTFIGSLLTGKFVFQKLSSIGSKIGITFGNMQIVFFVAAILLILCTLILYRKKHLLN